MKFVVEIDLDVFPTRNMVRQALLHAMSGLETIPEGVPLRTVLEKHDTVDYAIVAEMMDEDDHALCRGRAAIVRSDFNTEVLHKKQTHLHFGVQEGWARIG